MTDMKHNGHDHDTPNAGWGASREDVLIGRIVDGEASQRDFEDLERLGAHDADVWRRLAHAQRAHARLERAVEDRIALAELIDLPRGHRLGGGGVIARIGLFSGWAAAAALGIALLVQWPSPGIPAPGSATGYGIASTGAASAPRVELASFGPLLTTASPDEAYQQYLLAGLAEGRVIAEMPVQFVELREVPNSDVREVYLVRQTLERVPATEIWVPDLRIDDAGNLHSVPVRLREGAQEMAL
ncbi:MAG: hypothetical protein EA380_05975 [Phycisphaeraceae bacterium]|nr:MAG: hypothetical protein EA380_05975 [Phycisphaeraceae bacterium]